MIHYPFISTNHAFNKVWTTGPDPHRSGCGSIGSGDRCTDGNTQRCILGAGRSKVLQHGVHHRHHAHELSSYVINGAY